LQLLKHQFNNRFIRELPGDPSAENRPRQVLGAAWSAVKPTAVAAPVLLGWSAAMATELGIERPQSADDEWLLALAGNRQIEGMDYYAMAYAGHQFGNWAGQLGDGRAIGLGERLGSTGQSWEMQLKGAGPTPYSRTADGRAVLRSSLREFICSEAMHYLGVLTTRALSLVGSGESVVRDMFYDGHPEPEPGAIACRVAPSFIRFGNFQWPYAQQNTELLRHLVDFTIRHHYLEFDLADPNVYAEWFGEVCARTARMIVHWQAIGFVHGVMNTDNMSIHGLTIDYGPYGWLEPFDPTWTPNTTDAEGRRYAYGKQPEIGQWNCARLGDALSPLVTEIDTLTAGLDRYRDTFEQEYAERFASKLGLSQTEPLQSLLPPLFKLMQRAETDFCILFRRLAWVVEQRSETNLLEPLVPAFYDEEAITPELQNDWNSWLKDWLAVVDGEGRETIEIRRSMDAVNPKYVPRNYLAQQAIDAATAGDVSELEQLQTVLKQPYAEQPEYESYAGRRPEWARHKAGCSALSCSS